MKLSWKIHLSKVKRITAITKRVSYTGKVKYITIMNIGNVNHMLKYTCLINQWTTNEWLLRNWLRSKFGTNWWLILKQCRHVVKT